MSSWRGCWRSTASNHSLPATVQLRRGPQAHPCRREPVRTVPRGVSHSTIEELVDAPGSPFELLGLAEHQKVKAHGAVGGGQEHLYAGVGGATGAVCSANGYASLDTMAL